MFAVYDDENVICGTGETEAAAIADARHWLGLNYEGGEDVLATLHVDQCTDELAESVKTHGGYVAWEWSDTLPRYMTQTGEKK